MSLEKYVDLIKLVGLRLTAKFGSMEWIPFPQLIVLMYPILVRPFYCKSRFISIGAMTYMTTSL